MWLKNNGSGTVVWGLGQREADEVFEVDDELGERLKLVPLIGVADAMRFTEADGPEAAPVAVSTAPSVAAPSAAPTGPESASTPPPPATQNAANAGSPAKEPEAADAASGGA